MKTSKLLLLFILVSMVSRGQNVKLGCDSTTIKRITVKGFITFVDSTAKKIEASDGTATYTTCKLKYFGTGGAPDASTDMTNTSDIVYKVGNRDIPGNWILNFIRYKDK